MGLEFLRQIPRGLGFHYPSNFTRDYPGLVII